MVGCHVGCGIKLNLETGYRKWWDNRQTYFARTGFANFDWQDAGQFKTDKKRTSQTMYML